MNGTELKTEKTMKYNVRAAIFYRGKMLVVKRAASDAAYAGYWSIPGGCVDEGETLEEALYREIDEETGLRNIDTQMEEYFHFIYGRNHNIKDAHYMAEADDISSFYLDPAEHSDHAWIASLNELDSTKKNVQTTPEMRNSMEAALKAYSGAPVR